MPVIAAGFLAALAVWVIASPGQSLRAGSHHHPVTRQAASSPSIPSPSATASPSSLDQSVPDSPPPGVTWQIIDTVALPFSASAGPASVADGIPSGFAHTPTGALVAMVQIDFRHLIEPNFVAVTQADVANTPGRAKFFRFGGSRRAHQSGESGTRDLSATGRVPVRELHDLDRSDPTAHSRARTVRTKSAH